MPKKILIVEDEPDMRAILTLELETSGYEVFQAEDGAAGFKLAAEVKPDLVLSDVMMPHADGNQLSKQLRQSEFGRAIPFVVLTARRKMRDYFELFDGVVFVDKPFNSEDLLAKIQAALASPRPAAPAPAADRADAKPLTAPGIAPETTIIVEDQMVQQARPSMGDDALGRKRSDPAGAGILKGKRRGKILLLESDPRICGRIKDCFAKAGYEVKGVYSAARCVETAVLYAPDAVISKGVFTESKAEDLVKMLRQMSTFQNKPILVYSYTPSDDLKRRVLAAGANHFLVNPAETELLRLCRQSLQG